MIPIAAWMTLATPALAHDDPDYTAHVAILDGIDRWIAGGDPRVDPRINRGLVTIVGTVDLSTTQVAMAWVDLDVAAGNERTQHWFLQQPGWYDDPSRPFYIQMLDPGVLEADVPPALFTGWETSPYYAVADTYASTFPDSLYDLDYAAGQVDYYFFRLCRTATPWGRCAASG
ncbi:MAG: hypothetical protein R3F59_16600 [Myxococcota bacterium]